MFKQNNEKGIPFTSYTSISLVALSQRKVSVDSATKYVGAFVTICSKVYWVKVLDKITFINMGGPYPKSPLTVVIFTKDLVNFKETPEKLYSGKDICVTGKIDDYKGKTQIVVTKPEDIAVK
jgi:hypothetical protein